MTVVPAAPGTLDVASAAAELHAARLARVTVPTLTSRWSGMTGEEAYAVQAAGIGLRVADGETVIGGKLGFTSAAMRRAMGVDSPNHGWLTDAMLLPDGVAPVDAFVHPKVEPEIAFWLAEDLVAPVTVDDVLAATATVAGCLEVVDSRYDDFRFELLDNIADDSTAAGLVLGEPVPVTALVDARADADPLRTLGVVLSVDGEVVHTAAGAAAHDHPAAAVAWMANNCREPLRAGHVVISGGLTGPPDLLPGSTITAEFAHLGTVSIRMPAT